MAERISIRKRENQKLDERESERIDVIDATTTPPPLLDSFAILFA